MVLTIIIAFISIIALLVLHEFGHFIVAKKFGVKIEEFGIFLPPRLIGKKIGETIFSLNLLPLGAFVKLYGEEENIQESRSFSQKPVWQRALIILGGVVSFWLVAFILLTVVFGLGVPQAISDEEEGSLINPKVQILAVSSGSPAEEAGIKAGDTIKQFSINNLPTVPTQQFSIDKVKEVQDFTEQHKGEEIIVTIQRGKDVFEVKLTPRASPPEGEGAMGVVLVRTADKSYPWWQAPIKGMEATANLTGAVVKGWGQILGNLIQEKKLPKGIQLMGPIGIGAQITQAAQIGFNYFLQFIAVISIYLAVFNILPIPALDGGKLLFLAIEKIKRKPLNAKIEQYITAAFFVLLLSLIIFASIKDITRIF